MYSIYEQYLYRLHDTAKHRTLPNLSQQININYLDFSTNDYLQLSHHPTVVQAAILAAECYGVGATGSRLLSGNHPCFEVLEARIAQDKNSEAALVFNSGFQTNISVLSSLLDSKCLGTKPLVFFDKLNHASLYQAVFLSGAELIRYRHNDIQQLSELLNRYKNHNQPKFMVTETIFGMDGDVLPISEMVSLAEQHQAFLYLDESHAMGIIGPRGYGLSTTVDLKHIPHLVMGTFSKALGCSGGYIASHRLIKDYLINNSAGFIYSTANSPMVIGAVSAAWDMIRHLDKERQQLYTLSTYLRKCLIDLNFNVGTSNSHIIPIILGSEKLSIKTKEMLFENKIIVSCIRPPTVPPNTSRIRIALNVSHTHQDIEKLIQVLASL